jgi:polyamine oxidase
MSVTRRASVSNIKRMQPAPNLPRILVVGAGLAGLSAARVLNAAGFDVIILEARERIGGRIWTDRSLGAPVNMGANWIHGTSGNPLTALCRAAGVAGLELEGFGSTIVSADGSRLAGSIIDRSIEVFQEIRRRVEREARPNEALLNVLSRIAPDALCDPLLRHHMAVDMEWDAGGALARLGAAEWDHETAFPGPEPMVVDGYDWLPAYLAKGLQTRLGTTVQSITMSDTDVVVQTATGRLEADACVCAIPLGVLRSGSVSFDPPLPHGVSTAIAQLGWGHVNAIAFRFADAMPADWPLATGYASGRSDRYPYFVNLDRLHSGSRVMVTYAVGNFGEEIEGWSDEMIKGDVADAVRTVFGDEAPAIDELRASRWTRDPYARGSYSFASPEAGKESFAAFSESGHPRLVLAGEHTHADRRGTAHGALLSGELAASRLIEAIGRP